MRTLTLVTFILAVVNLNAQNFTVGEFSAGGTLGANVVHGIFTLNNYHSRLKPGITTSVFGTLAISRRTRTQLELMYQHSTLGEFDDASARRYEIATNNIALALLFDFHFQKIGLHTGTQATYNMAWQANNLSSNDNVSPEEVRKWGASAILGASYDLHKNFFINTRVAVAMIQFFDWNETTWHYDTQITPVSISVSIGYTFYTKNKE